MTSSPISTTTTTYSPLFPLDSFNSTTNTLVIGASTTVGRLVVPEIHQNGTTINQTISSSSSSSAAAASSRGHLIELDATRNSLSGVNVLGIGVIATSADSNGTQQGGTSTTGAGMGYNGTGFYIEDENETGFTDLQTVFLACFSTLVFLAIILLTAFGIRILWKKYNGRKDNARYDGILHREGTAESISTRPLHSHLLSEDNKSCDETHLALNTEEVEICNTIEVNTQIRSNHSSTNGSIITMTLKNNHLIVETEERNDLEEDSRETTMKYCPGARDGVFVVEVQQGMRRSPSREPEVSISVSDQCALVHNPPERYSDEDITCCGDDDNSEYIETISPLNLGGQQQSTTTTTSSVTPVSNNDNNIVAIKTGLCQSNTSLNNPPYCYTNQQGYEIGNYGYSVQNDNYNDYNNSIPAGQLCKPIEDTRPKITAAVYKKSSLKRSPSTEDLHLASIEGGGSSRSSPILENILMQQCSVVEENEQSVPNEMDSNIVVVQQQSDQ